MRHLWLILSVLLALAACKSQPVTDPMDNFDCADDPGAQPINIHYGDSQIKVTPPLYKVHKNKNLKFKLLADNQAGPDNLDYGKVTVTISSKDTATNTWINTSGTKDKDGTLVACMPTSQPLGVVEYLVEVDKVGQLDPRADVIP
jgi:hypothetical protein